MSFRSHKFSRNAAPGQLSFEFLAPLQAAANIEPFELVAPASAVADTPAKVVPIRKPRARKVVVGGAQMSFDLVVVALPEVVAPAAKPETVYEFLRRHGKLTNYTKAALKGSKVARAMTDEELRKDLSQALHMRWMEIEVDSTKADLQAFRLASISGRQAVQKAAFDHLGAVRINGSTKRSMSGDDYAALATATRAPLNIEDYTDSAMLCTEADEIEDEADVEFLAARLRALDIKLTPVMVQVANLLLLERIMDAGVIAKRIGISKKQTLNLMATLTQAFEAANDRDIFDRQAA